MSDASNPAAQDRPLVTFALFAYNQEQYIREAVEGAFSQTYSPLEIILSDDCSTDRTFEIMQEMAAAYEGPHEVRVRRNSVNFGLAQHLNEIAKISKGTIMSWAAGDDIALPRRTEKFVDILERKSKVDYVHSALEHIDVNSVHLSFYFHDYEIQKPNFLSAIRGMSRIATQSCAFRREAFEAFGPLKSTVTQEAMVMGFRASYTGVEYIAEPLTKYRIGSGVSTYQGRDIIRLRQLEPLKVSGWHKTSLEQMVEDVDFLDINLRKQLKPIIVKRLNYWSEVHVVNTVGFSRDTVNYILSGSHLGPELIRAILRNSIPLWFYKVLKKLDHPYKIIR